MDCSTRHLALTSTFVGLSLSFTACRDDDAAPGADGESSPTTGELGESDQGDGDSS